MKLGSKVVRFVLQVKDTGKGASREEAQQQAAKKVNNSFHFNGSLDPPHQ